MNVFSQLRSVVVQVLEQLTRDGQLVPGLAFDAVDVMPPRESGHGDMATNAAMVLASKAGKKPRELAELIKSRLESAPDVQSVDIAGPGFLNLHFAPSFWHAVIPVILKENTRFGASDIGAGQKINVEYVSANPTGPMHVGHGRGAVVGDALASLLIKAGFSVTREYYINDAGAQVDVLAESFYLRYREANGEAIGDIPEGLYPGDYLVAPAQAFKVLEGDKWLSASREQWLSAVRGYALDAMMNFIKSDLEQLGIKHDVFTSERKLTDESRIEEVLALLESRDLIYTGVLEPPKGKPMPEDWEPKPQTLFRSTKFGDDIDRALKKSDGSWTYFAPDIAYHYDKIQRGFLRMVDVLGADHGGYAKRIQAAVNALSDGKASLEVRLSQMVKFMRAGEPVKMSKRKGTFMTVREVVDEVGAGAFRFIMLTRKNDAPLDFDFVKVVEQSKDNPVFYVQYAHARAHSVRKMAQEQEGVAAAFSESPTKEQLALLTQPAELDLIRLMASYPRIVEAAAIAYEPHRIAFYLQELAAAFHGLWNMGNGDITLRFIQKDAIDLTAARLALVRACATVIASGLLVLGVTPVEEMR